MESLQAILFDNDGVLVDTEALYFRANREALASVGAVLDEATYVECLLREGVGVWHLAEARGVSPAGIEALRALRDRRYFELVDEAEIVIPGVADLLPSLAARYRLGIVTSSEPGPFARTHARTGLLPHFEFALTRVDYEQSKPHPEPYLTAVARLGLAPARCLVIEDSERGLRAAKAAGLACWVIPSGLTASGNFAAADAVLSDLAAAVARLLRER
ncbi:MAG TPA: HAD family phosphatase [Polyangia bacterium]|nr:HAD family phosphatase [Polyangia bacterium]